LRGAVPGYARLMGTGEIIALVVAVGLTLAAIVYFVAVRRHPENTDRHDDPPGARADVTGRGTLPGDVQERPAGPDAESQAVTDRDAVESGGAGPSTGEDRGAP
jgi:hypothetical protein